MQHRFALTITATTGRVFVPFLEPHLLRAHALLSPPLVELSVALVGDRRMARLHQQFMNIPGPTDVLTFELDYNSRGKVTEGEVVICAAVAARESRRRGIPMRLELLLYCLHGMLHLCGFDDRTELGFAAMHRKEDQILTQLGVGPVFRGDITDIKAPPANRRRAGAR